MRRPAVRAGGATGWWLLGLLTLGPARSLSAGEEEPGSPLCSRSFYRQTPPAGLFPGGPLSPLCHPLPRGRAFATLHSAACDSPVGYALHLGPGGGESEGEGETTPGKDKGEDESGGVEDGGPQREGPPAGTPALLRVDGGAMPDGPSDSALQSWDLLVSELLRDSLVPLCSSAGAGLYVLTGVGGERRPGGEEEATAGDGGCEAGVLWSAACCAGPGGEGGAGVGLVREAEGRGERVVSVKELEEAIGATELFAGGCGGTGEEEEGGLATLLGEALVRSVEKQRAGRLGATDEDLAEAAGSSAVAPSTGEDQIAADTSASDANTKELGDVEPVMMQRSTDDSETGSTLVYLISSSVSLLTAPLRPVVSTIVQIPGQVTYVLQEDLGLLAALPGDALSLLHLLTSDLSSGLGAATDLLVGLGARLLSGLASCSSSMAETLLSSCHTGVTGVGTLAGDGVGVVGGIADHAWWAASVFGGRVLEQSEGYVGAVVSEMGGQVKAVGGGLGKLAGRIGSGVGRVVGVAGGLVVGSVEMVVGAVNEAFGRDSG